MARKKLSLHQLESYLQDLDEFEQPKVDLEQYATPAHIAALILNTIDSTFDDLDGKIVADLGCGTGRLMIGSLMIGARFVFGFDIDRDALGSSIQNINDIFSDDDEPPNIGSSAHKACERFNLIQADIASNNCDTFWKPWSKFFDSVVMNPPFGTKNNPGLDMLFLKRAIDMAHNSVYSLHKTSTREFIKNKCQQWGVCQAKPVAQIRYNLDKTYKFHKKKSVDIDVDLWQIKL